MKYDVCDRCGVKIPEGGLKYIVRVNIIADDDNIISEDITDEELDAMISGIKEFDPDMLERDVHQDLAFVLCKRCKEQFVRNPFNTIKDKLDMDEGWSGELH
ncbi:MAG TPA: hypothetical protein DCQ99_03185 [Nitrospinae bacterium]|nr:hypothetical protein [Nitrospinota bacterium]HBA27573.1 hypothetical protein [Nitrospinota bacterium]